MELTFVLDCSHTTSSLSSSTAHGKRLKLQPLEEFASIVKGLNDTQSETAASTEAHKGPQRRADYAVETGSFVKPAHRSDSKARIELFQFLTYCSILEELGVISDDEANTLVERAGSNGNSDNLRRIRDGANKLIKKVTKKLIKTGLSTGKASLLTALYMPPKLSAYARINTNLTSECLEEATKLSHLEMGDSVIRTSCVLHNIHKREPNVEIDGARKILGCEKLTIDDEDEREAGAMGLEDDGTRLSDYLYNTEYGKDIRDWETQYAPSVVHEQ